MATKKSSKTKKGIQTSSKASKRSSKTKQDFQVSASAAQLAAADREKLIRSFTFQKRIGEVFIALGLLLPIIPFVPLWLAELRFEVAPVRVNPISEQTRPTISKTEFKIIIPKIGVDAPVIRDVDSRNYTDYMHALRQGVAHAEGTAKPGEPFGANRNVFLFAHSTLEVIDAPKYNAVFMFLRKLEKGDMIQVVYNGEIWNYEVVEKKVVEAAELQYLTEPSFDSTLTLQTCDPPGTNLRRLLIRAKPVDATKPQFALK